MQVVFHPEDAADAHTAAQRLSAEDVVQVTGRVHTRPAGMTNPQLPTGEVEVAAASVEMLSEAETPPFPSRIGSRRARSSACATAISISAGTR